MPVRFSRSTVAVIVVRSISRMSRSRDPDWISSEVSSNDTGTVIRLSMRDEEPAAEADALPLAGAGSSREIRVEAPLVTTAARGVDGTALGGADAAVRGSGAGVGGCADNGADESMSIVEESCFPNPNIRASLPPNPTFSGGVVAPCAIASALEEVAVMAAGAGVGAGRGGGDDQIRTPAGADARVASGAAGEPADAGGLDDGVFETIGGGATGDFAAETGATGAFVAEAAATAGAVCESAGAVLGAAAPASATFGDSLISLESFCRRMRETPFNVSKTPAPLVATASKCGTPPGLSAWFISSME